MKWQRTDIRGFTLIEILMVLTVIGIVSTGIVLSATVMDREDRIRRACEDLEVTFRTTSDLAAVRQGLFVIELVPGSHAIQIYTSIANKKTSEPWLKELPADVVLDAVRIGNDVIVTRRVEVLVQPSGFIQEFSLRLVLGDVATWARWDPISERIILDSSSD